MKRVSALLLVFIGLFGCKDKNNNFVFFSAQQDVELGQQVSQEIESDPATYPILDENTHPDAYEYIRDLLDVILDQGGVEYREEFAWEIKIIADDDVLNAFATPGGYIYVYTGLIKYLDEEDDLMGVLGHEVAHADLRHTSRNLQRIYGIQILSSIILGEEASQLAEIAAGIAGQTAALRFSREFEAEADDRSVEYLAPTIYACNGAYSFFQKLIDADQTGSTPEFLSTHPDPEDRVADINAKADELGCDTTPYAPASYQDFKNMLP
jgi:predicted Zn-dependent protease